jgi:hypothetical protein
MTTFPLHKLADQPYAILDFCARTFQAVRKPGTEPVRPEQHDNRRQQAGNPVHNVKRHAASWLRRSATYRACSMISSSLEGTGWDQR